jgi:hypothetical protein
MFDEGKGGLLRRCGYGGLPVSSPSLLLAFTSQLFHPDSGKVFFFCTAFRSTLVRLAQIARAAGREENFASASA